MKQFNELTYSELIDMLAKHTVLYTQLLSDNIKTTEFYKCRRLIEKLTAEIKKRKHATSSGNSATNQSVSSY
jgi:hypothetical protein